MLKLIAPFRAMLNLDSSFIAANQARYIQFLEAVRTDLENTNGRLRSRLTHQPEIEVNVPIKQIKGEIDSRYVTVQSSGSFYISPRLMRLSFKINESANIQAIYREAVELADTNVAKYSAVFDADLSSLYVDLHDNTIGIVSLELHINRQKLDTASNAWSKLDEWTTSLVFYLLRGLYQSYIFPLLAALREFSVTGGYNIVETLEQYKIFFDMTDEQNIRHADMDKRFMLMWVNRTLCYTQDFPKNDWISAMARSSGAVFEAEVHINQGNCVILLPQNYNLKKVESFWDVMYPAQYFYAAMDVVNMNLIKYIGATFNRQTSRKLREINNDMEEIINSVTILQVRYSDLSMEMQGVARKIFMVLQQEWDFPSMVNNLQKKLDLCKANITVLNHETSNRNQGRTELMLTSLAGISIMSIFIELGSYASQMPSENKWMVGDMPGFMSLGFLLSGNALSWIGIVIALGVIAFTLKHKR